MKFTVDRAAFLAAAQAASRAVSARSPAAILTCLFLESDGDRLKVRATDADIWIDTTCPASFSLGGQTAIPAAKLVAALSKATADSVEVSVNNQGMAKIKAGKAKFELPTHTGSFPEPIKIPDDKFFEVNASDLRRVVGQTAFCVDENHNKNALRGVCFEIEDDTLYAMGSDGRRMAVAEAPLNDRANLNGNFLASLGTQISIPVKSVKEVANLFSNEVVSIHVGPSMISFRGANLSVTTRTLEGYYPDARPIVTRVKDLPTSIISSRLYEAVEQAAVTVSQETNRISVSVGRDTISIKSQAADIGESESEIEAESSIECETLLDNRYVSQFLREAVKVDGGTISARFDPREVNVFQAGNYTYGLMPMSLEK